MLSGQSSTIVVEPVVVAGSDKGFALWPTLGLWDQVLVPLHGAMSDVDAGSAVHTLLWWLDEDVDPDSATSADGLVATTLDAFDRNPGVDDPGSTLLRFSDPATGTTFETGCCFGLTDRGRVHDTLGDRSDEVTSGLGHTPDVRLTVHGDTVRLDADTSDPDSPVLHSTREALGDQVTRVEERLDAFVGRVADWATDHAPAHRDRLAASVARILRTRHGA